MPTSPFVVFIKLRSCGRTCAVVWRLPCIQKRLNAISLANRRRDEHSSMISWSSQIDNNSSKGKEIISAIDAAPNAGCIGLSLPTTGTPRPLRTSN
jgi:hypothetical protein